MSGLIETSENISELVGALATARTEFRPIVMRGIGLARGSKQYPYATIQDVIEATAEPLAKHGLVLIQAPVVGYNGGGRYLVSTLAHKSGQWIRVTSPLDIREGGTAQETGSATTYARRYAAYSLLNIAGEEDDDGAEASNVPTPPRSPSPPPRGGNVHPVRERDSAPVQPASGRAESSELKTLYMELLKKANDTRTPTDGESLMEMWLGRAGHLMELRLTPSRAKSWETLVKTVGDALHRAFGEIYANAWQGMVEANTSNDVATIRKMWDGFWAKDVKLIEDEKPNAFRLLKEHMEMQTRRVEAEVAQAA